MEEKKILEKIKELGVQPAFIDVWKKRKCPPEKVFEKCPTDIWQEWKKRKLTGPQEEVKILSVVPQHIAQRSKKKGRPKKEDISTFPIITTPAVKTTIRRETPSGLIEEILEQPAAFRADIIRKNNLIDFYVNDINYGVLPEANLSPSLKAGIQKVRILYPITEKTKEKYTVLPYINLVLKRSINPNFKASTNAATAIFRILSKQSAEDLKFTFEELWTILVMLLTYNYKEEANLLADAIQTSMNGNSIMDSIAVLGNREMYNYQHFQIYPFMEKIFDKCVFIFAESFLVPQNSPQELKETWILYLKLLVKGCINAAENRNWWTTQQNSIPLLYNAFLQATGVGLELIEVQRLHPLLEIKAPKIAEFRQVCENPGEENISQLLEKCYFYITEWPNESIQIYVGNAIIFLLTDMNRTCSNEKLSVDEKKQLGLDFANSYFIINSWVSNVPFPSQRT